MKRRVLCVLLIVALLIPVAAQAVTPRGAEADANIIFNGTTATCSARIIAVNPTDRITATMILYNGARQVDRWVASGTGDLSFSFPATVESGVTYRLLVRYSINGVQQTAAEIQKTCP